jgi:hypothetical protein
VWGAYVAGAMGNLYKRLVERGGMCSLLPRLAARNYRAVGWRGIIVDQWKELSSGVLVI